VHDRLLLRLAGELLEVVAYRLVQACAHRLRSVARLLDDAVVDRRRDVHDQPGQSHGSCAHTYRVDARIRARDEHVIRLDPQYEGRPVSG
jgi:hypothetical protein